MQPSVLKCIQMDKCLKCSSARGDFAAFTEKFIFFQSYMILFQEI